MRLDKYLAETAQCTRSEAKAMLSKGRVQKGRHPAERVGHRGRGRQSAVLPAVRVPHAQQARGRGERFHR